MNKVIYAYLIESFINYHTHTHTHKFKIYLNLKLRSVFTMKEVLLKETIKKSK